jgi:hypothetical protein
MYLNLILNLKNNKAIVSSRFMAVNSNFSGSFCNFFNVEMIFYLEKMGKGLHPFPIFLRGFFS